MTKQTRRRFTPKYKEQAVARWSEEGVSHASLAGEPWRDTSGQFKTWHLELLAAGSAAALARSKAAAELAQSRRDNKRLKEDNEVMRNPRTLPWRSSWTHFH